MLHMSYDALRTTNQIIRYILLYLKIYNIMYISSIFPKTLQSIFKNIEKHVNTYMYTSYVCFWNRFSFFKPSQICELSCFLLSQMDPLNLKIWFPLKRETASIQSWTDLEKLLAFSLPSLKTNTWNASSRWSVWEKICVHLILGWFMVSTEIWPANTICSMRRLGLRGLDDTLLLAPLRRCNLYPVAAQVISGLLDTA